jgi:hypothetical protein
MKEDAIEIAAPASDAGLDIADQPTIVLGPNDQSAQQAAEPPSPSGETDGLAAPANVRPANAAATSEALADEGVARETSDEGVVAAPEAAAGFGVLSAQDSESLAASEHESVSVTDVEMTMPPETHVPAPEGTGTAQRVPESAAYGDLPQRNLSPYITAGVLAATGAASIAYLLWSRRQRAQARQVLSVNDALARLQRLRAAGAVAQQALSAQASQFTPRARYLTDRGTQAAANAQLRAAEWWGLLADRASELGGTLGGLGSLADLARRRTPNSVKTSPASTGLRGRMTSWVPAMTAIDAAGLRARVGGLATDSQAWLGDMMDTARGWVPDRSTWNRLSQAGRSARLSLPTWRWRPVRRAGMMAAAQQARMQVLQQQVRDVRLATRKSMRRAGRQARWFRNGAIAGAVWGILYAPVGGREARAVAARYLKRVPYLGEYVGTGGELAGAVGGTGPHPRSDLASSHAPYPGTPGGSPLLEPASEEPMLPRPEGDVGSLSEGASAL